MRLTILIFAVSFFAYQCKEVDKCMDPGNEITNKVWKLKSLDGQAMPDSVAMTLKFDCEAVSFSALGGCNGHGGNFSLQSNDGNLSFELGPATQIACYLLPFEIKYTEALEKTDKFTHQNSILTLLEGTKVLAVFETE